MGKWAVTEPLVLGTTYLALANAYCKRKQENTEKGVANNFFQELPDWESSLSGFLKHQNSLGENISSCFHRKKMNGSRRKNTRQDDSTKVKMCLL